MGFLKTIGLVILSVLFAVSTAGVVYVYSAQNSLFNPSFYSNALESSGSYAQIQSFLVDMLAGQLTAQVPDSSALGVDLVDKKALEANVKTELSQAITTAWVKQQSNALLAGVLGYVNGETNALNAQISLAEPKAKLKEKLAVLLGGTEVLTALESQTGKGLLDELPDKADLAAQLNIRASDLQPLRDAKQGLSTGLIAGGVISLILALLIILLTRSLKGILRWIGAGLALSGLAVLGLSKAAGVGIDALAGQPGVPPVVISLVNSLVAAIMSQAATIGVAMLVVGVIGVVASFVIKTGGSEPTPGKKSRKQQEEDEEEK